MSLARLSIPHGTLTWAGVGNVEGRLLKASGGRKPSSSYLDPQQGIVGHQIPTLRSRTLPLDRGDVILFATDGVKGGFASAQGPSIFREPAGRIAERILEEFAAGRDDALLLVARYLGRGGTP